MERLIYQGSADDEERIRAILERATREILNKLGAGGLEAIVLTGGFGRGEGALRGEAGTSRLPFNDLDFLLIGTRSHVAYGLMRGLKNSLPGLLGVDFVDLGYIRSSQFRGAPPTIFLYDLKNGSRVIWGSAGALENVPVFQSSDLPFSEATRLFLNRGIGLLYTLVALDRDGIGPVIKKNAATAWSKIILAAGDAMLLRKRLYHWSYVERIKRVEEIAPLFDLGPDFLGKYRSAAMFKLTADFDLLPSSDPARLCLEAESLHERYFRWVEERRTFAEIKDWRTYPLVLLRAGLRPLRSRLKDSFAVFREAATHLDTMTRFLRLPLWGEERRLALLPLVLYSAKKPEGMAQENRYLEAACMLEYGRNRIRSQDWMRLASALVGESHP